MTAFAASGRVPRIALAALALAALAAAPQTAAAQSRGVILPYVEIDQVVNYSFDDNDVLTYTALAAGVDAQVETRRVAVRLGYRYERRIPWDDELPENDIHSGIAQAHVALSPELAFDAGAIAARTAADISGPRPGFAGADIENVAEVYGVYAGPTLNARVGRATVNASYRLGYVDVDSDAVGVGGTEPGRVLLTDFGGSVTHEAKASVGVGPGPSTPGWTVGAGYVREENDFLEHRYEGKYVRADVVVPVSPTLALTAGVGYEDIEASQQDFVRDETGRPAIGPDGDIVADPDAPRLLVYDEQGIIGDAGIIWRPGPHTELAARAGWRYGDVYYLGTLEHRLSPRLGLSASVYRSIDSFSRLILADVSGLSTDFDFDPQIFGAPGGCVFGEEPGQGGCFDSLQAISSNNFRHTGANLILSGSRGRWTYSAGISYAHREYLTPTDDAFPLAGVSDQSISLNVDFGRRLSRSSGLDFDLYASWYDSSLAGIDGVFSTGARAAWYKSLFYERLQARAALGIHYTDFELGDSTDATAQLGIRYSF